jgi:hypothetical protein
MQIKESAVSLRASNISLWTNSGQQALLAHMSRSELLDYLVARSFGFRKGDRRTFRGSLLDNANRGYDAAYWLSVLTMGAAAGDPGSVATFTEKRPGEPLAFGPGSPEVAPKPSSATSHTPSWWRHP